MQNLPGKILRPEAIALIAAVIVLLLGVLVYAIDRQPGTVYFMSDWMRLGEGRGSVFGLLGRHLPTFVHVYTFILLTMALVVPAGHYRHYLLPVCLGWFVIDCLFEIAQLNFIAHVIAGWAPAWFAGIPFLENTANYFRHGRFDLLDLFSIGLGALAAYLTMQLIIKRSAHRAVSVNQS
ncbi:MAG: hypothetical protein L0Z73_06345 [Gammaproteobacteria bacterium]|nr:hypothetical protein [Gammaproteobacteria bacterium]